MAKKQVKSVPESIPAASAAAAAVTKSKATPASKPTRVKAAHHTHASKDVSPASAPETKPVVVTVEEVEEILMQPAVPVSEVKEMPLSELPAEEDALAMEQVSLPAVEDARAAIEKLAYGYYEARGFKHGDPLEDWVRAEREYRSSRS